VFIAALKMRFLDTTAAAAAIAAAVTAAAAQFKI